MPTSKTALVTGANRGIGLELCRALAKTHDVIGVCRTPSPQLSALKKVRVESGIDVTDGAALEALGKRLEADGTQLDLLIANAGILRSESLEALDFASIEAQLEVNALGPLRTVAALRGTLAQDSKLALITSRMGSIADNGSGGYYGYRMSKAALNAAGVSLAHDLRGRGVAVVILHPGFVRTEMTGGGGSLEPAESARMLLERIDALTLATTGRFLHANGEQLPW
jgi:NAD(P)-dependent dehydrogenase (short-subunit alcohol dehydrogenase family)